MPNYVYCHAAFTFEKELTDEEVNQFKELCFTKFKDTLNNSEYEAFDFAKLIPRPDNIYDRSESKETSLMLSAWYFMYKHISTEEDFKEMKANNIWIEYDHNGDKIVYTEYREVNEKIRQFMSEIDLDKFEQFLSTLEKPLVVGWYDWQCHNWGTKWNACSSDIYIEGENIIVTFQTAWGIDHEKLFIPFIEKLAKEMPQFVNFCIDMREESMAWAGEFIINKDQIHDYREIGTNVFTCTKEDCKNTDYEWEDEDLSYKFEKDINGNFLCPECTSIMTISKE